MASSALHLVNAQRVWHLDCLSVALNIHGWIVEGHVDGVTPKGATGFRGVVAINRFTGDSRPVGPGLVAMQLAYLEHWVIPESGPCASLDAIVAFMDQVKQRCLTLGYVERAADPINDPD